MDCQAEESKIDETMDKDYCLKGFDPGMMINFGKEMALFSVNEPPRGIKDRNPQVHTPQAAGYSHPA
jgi:hypothetical protein